MYTAYKQTILECYYHAIFEEGSEQVALETTVSMLDHYLSRPKNPIFDDIKYCEYYEQYMVSNTLPRVATMA